MIDSSAILVDTTVMKLLDYLNQQKLSPKQFAPMVGVSDESIRRYCKGTRKPNAEVMTSLMKATKGKVQPNDFFPLVNNTL